MQDFYLHSLIACLCLVSVRCSDKHKHEGVDLGILHINDIHSHFDKVNAHVGRCHQFQENEGKCFGGAARLHSKVEKIVGEKWGDSTLLLNAGKKLWLHQGQNLFC